MSDEEEAGINKTLKSLKQLAGGAIITVVLISFSAGVWATGIKNDANSIKADLEHIRSQQDKSEEATAKRVSDWTAWRQEVNTQLDKRIQDRYTATDYEWTKSLYNMQNPPVRLPDYQTVKRAQQ